MSSAHSSPSPSTAFNRPSWLCVFSVLLLGSFLGFLAPRWPAGPINTLLGWKTSQFFYNYQDLGFVKRGLIGSLIHPFPVLQTDSSLFLISWSFVAALAALFAQALVLAMAALSRKDAWLLLLLCASSPALFPRQGFDVGRFDSLGLIAVLLSLFFLIQRKPAAAGACSALALLTHEAYLCINLPLLLAFLWEQNQGNRGKQISSALQLVCPTGFVFAAIILFGRYEPGLPALLDYFQHNQAYLTAQKEPVNLDAIQVLTRGFGDNFRYSFQTLLSKKAELHLPLIFLWGVLMLVFFRQWYARNGLKKDLLFYACFSPLLLSLIACDVYRWVALTATNMIFAILIELHLSSKSLRQLSLPHGPWTWLLFASALLGPISNTKSFPVILTFLDKLFPGWLVW